MTAPSLKILEELQWYRGLHAEATDPLAVRLLQDIIAELEASLPTEQQEQARRLTTARPWAGIDLGIDCEGIPFS